MPDKRKHRGAHPDDQSLFTEKEISFLRNAVGDLSWLLSKNYNDVSSLKLVGDRYRLNARQQMAVRRSCCTIQSFQYRKSIQKGSTELNGADIFIDGYNTLITIESFFSGGYLFLGMDGCIRDLASIHGSYRKVEETTRSISVISSFIWSKNPKSVTWYLDAPVSNSGRLKGIIKEISPESNVELVPDADKQLLISEGIIITTDGPLLDKLKSWYNLNNELTDYLSDTTKSKIVDLKIQPPVVA